MTIDVGTHIGAYEITALIGEGGMGRVFRARDATLQRDVALKVLPESWSRDPDRLARLEREARLLAALNHPHIAGIHHLEQAGGASVLVMEFVQGPTLAERLGHVGRVLSDPPRLPGPKGPGLPIEEALAIAVQIAHALEAAHAKGIIHRDLKPANIKITPEGQVKLLDFGLAKAFDDRESSIDVTHSPTVLGGPTMAGVILGTAAYMSPEQARGQRVDVQTDIWTFGCVLYEMLTARRAFTGETVTDILAAVVRGEPDWAAVPPDTPRFMRSLLRRCLQKDPARRLHHIADVRIDIEDAKDDAHAPGASPQKPRHTERWAWIAVAVLSLGAALLSAFVLFALRPAAAPPEMRVEITTPPTSDLTSLAISADGQTLAFAATVDGQTRLWVRPLNAVSARALPGTNNAAFPFWSPDGKSLGFFADGKLKRIDLAGGSVQTLANASTGRGGAWSRDGMIVFAPTAVGQIFRMRADGGPPAAVTHLAPPNQFGHEFPRFLPDGRRFVFFARGNAEGRGIFLASLDGTEKRLVDADSAAVLAPGHLLFARQGVLFAQPFELDRVAPVGDPAAVGDSIGVGQEQGPVALAASMAGPIAYRTAGGSSDRQLIWFDRSGKKLGDAAAVDTAFPTDPELSPDGRRITVERFVGGNSDIWIIDVTRGVLSRFTSELASDLYPVWSPDGRQIVFCSSGSGVYNLYRRSSSDTGGDELLLASLQNKAGNDMSSDGRFLLYRVTAEQTGFDLWAMPLAGDRKPFAVAQTKFDEREGQFSPDGKWMAFQSNETERFEIYVQPFPGPGGKTRVSTNGGTQVRWRRDGKELFYVGLDGKLTAVPIRLAANGGPVEAAAPVTLFQTHIVNGGPRRQQYAVAPDGQRFLINSLMADAVTPPITLILNWKGPTR